LPFGSPRDLETGESCLARSDGNPAYLERGKPGARVRENEKKARSGSSAFKRRRRRGETVSNQQLITGRNVDLVGLKPCQTTAG